MAVSALLPGRRLASRVERPGEERVEICAADLLARRDEVGSGDISVAVVAIPDAEDREELVVTDLLPQCLQSHGPPDVNRRVEEVGRIPGVGRRSGPMETVSLSFLSCAVNCNDQDQS